MVKKCFTYGWKKLQCVANSPLNGTMNLKLLHIFFCYCSQGSDQGDKSNRCVCAFTHMYMFVCCTRTLSAVCQHNTCRRIAIDKYTQYTKGY